MSANAINTIYPIRAESLARYPWERLNAVDLAVLAEATVETVLVVPAGRKVPPRVHEALTRMFHFSELSRQNRLHMGKVMAVVPAPEGDPMDFPADPLGLVCWPWRQAMWDVGWDAHVSHLRQEGGPAMLIGGWPDARRSAVRPYSGAGVFRHNRN